MKKTLIILSLLMSINVYADVISDAYAQVDKGNHKKAREMFNRACENKNPKGCINLGLMYKNGAGVEKDHLKTISLWEKACEMDDADGCIRAAFMHSKSKNIKSEQIEANVLFKKACTLGDSLGCEMYQEYKKNRIN